MTRSLVWVMMLTGRPIPTTVAYVSSVRIFGRRTCNVHFATTTAIDDEFHPPSNTLSQQPSKSPRTNGMQDELHVLGVDFRELHLAAIQSIEDPTKGYDARYGKSAIKAYRSFAYPRKKEQNDDLWSEMQLKTKALTAARQVDFLIKRHKSREADWVRHTDTATSRRTFPLILLLDNVRSAFNVGSLFRTADACGCMEVITTGITPHPVGSGAEKLSKSALGADRVVPNRHFATTHEAVQELRKEKPSWQLIGMETTDQSVLYTQLQYTGNSRSDDTEFSTGGTVLLLGNEVTGVDTEIMPLLDHVVEIPMFGAKNSLNIAACAPVVLYEILRQWGVEPSTTINTIKDTEL